jgi:dephospho-CoA kinase
MPSVAVTGTIGSGKSLITAILSKSLPSVTYSADQDNTLLLETDPDVKREILSLFGVEAYRSDSTPDRTFLRQAILASREYKRGLEAILHPRLRKRWESLAGEFHRIPDRFLIAELPLLFENNLEDRFDVTVTVACSHEVRCKRLENARNMPPGEVLSWTSSQLSQDNKIAKADHVLWNDGSVRALEAQGLRLATLLSS